MKIKFHIGKGRYDSLKTSRYMKSTYGEESFTQPTEEMSDDETHGTYGALLFDKRWKDKRAEIITRDRGCCVICKSSEKLQVHHRQYHFIKGLNQFKAPWDYENRLMITMCERCHSKGHGKYKVPNIYL